MKQEDKRQLLLKDLCARLPYGTIVECSIGSGESIDLILTTSHIYELLNESLIIKPYLRSMSNMTEEEKKEFAKVMVRSQDCSYENNESATTMTNDWYLSKHFDVRGLIPKGLAIEAPEGMYK